MTDEEMTKTLEDILSDPQGWLSKSKKRAENLLKEIDILCCKIEKLEEHLIQTQYERDHWYNKCEIIFDASGLVKDLKEELDHIHKQIKDALDLVGNRYYEWGERAMMAFKVLEGLIEEEEE